MHCTVFISDLHLREQQPELFALWQKFSHEQLLPMQPDALYILGDFFALWSGDDDLTPFNSQVIASLKYLVDHGVPVILLPGNRDFLLGKTFAAMSGCELLSDPAKIDLYGVPVLLTHGDMLCSKDYVMKIFRFVTRSYLGKKIFLSLPLFLRRRIAKHIYNISQKTRKEGSKDKKLFAIDDRAINKMLLKYQARQIIYGHVHRPNIVTKSFGDGNNIQQVVLGEWTADGSNMFIKYADGSYEMK